MPENIRKLEIWSPMAMINSEYEVIATHLGKGSEWTSTYQIVLTDGAPKTKGVPLRVDGWLLGVGKVQNNTDEDWTDVSLNLHTGYIKLINEIGKGSSSRTFA